MPIENKKSIKLPTEKELIEILTETLEYYIAVIETSTMTYTFANDLYCAKIGKSREQIIGSHIYNVIGHENYNYALPYLELAKKGEKACYENSFTLVNGVQFLMVSYIPLKDKNEETYAILVVSNDITEKKTTESKLKERKNKLESIFRSSPSGIGLVVNRVLTEVNDRICEMTGYSKAELIGKNSRVLYPTDDEYNYVGEEKYRQIKNKGTGTVETKWKTKKGEIINILMSSTPLDLTDLSRGVTFTVLDITDKKKTEEKLGESRRIFSTLLNNLPGIAYQCENDPEWTMKFISKGCMDITGYPPETFINNNEKAFADIIDPEDRNMVWQDTQKALSKNAAFELEYRIWTSDGAIKYVWERGIGIYDNKSNISHLEGFISDITERKNAQKQIQYDLAEKNVLLQEIHHRVKNNLQIIIGLLALQADRSKSTHVKENLHECSNRVYSMAIIHERLYKSQSLSKIDLLEYCKAVAFEIINSYGNPDSIDIEIKMDPVSVTIGKAIPCGLILTEIITNTVKHAFIKKHSGLITIEGSEIETGDYILRISDNGKGLPEEIDPETSMTMGLQLMRMLAGQMKAQIKFIRDNGTAIQIIFSP